MGRKSAELKLLEVIEEIGLEKTRSLLKVLDLSRRPRNAPRRKGASQPTDCIGKMQLAPQGAPGQPSEIGDPVPLKPIVFGGPGE